MLLEDEEGADIQSRSKATAIIDALIKAQNFNQAAKHIEQFAEYPELLEGYLPLWMPRIVEHLDDAACLLVYQLCLVCGHECVIPPFFPCSLSISQSVFSRFLAASEGDAWQNRYVYTLWTVLLIKLPFPLSRILHNLHEHVLAKMRSLLRLFAAETRPAAIFLANYHNRPDVREALQFSLSSIGELYLLYELLKLNSSKVQGDLLDQVLALRASGPLMTRLQLKIICRLASDRRSFDLSLSLLTKEKNLNVRWTAAKTAALLVTAADQQLTSQLVLQLCLDAGAPCSEGLMTRLHGLLLFTGHLIKQHRRVLSLDFLLNLSGRVVGHLVRDAACYVAWVAAQQELPFSDTVFEALILQALCDREVQVRRAASAVLQECIGRGCVGHFLAEEVLRVIDFYSVMHLERTFSSPLLGKLASSSEYLRGKAIGSPDARIRSLAAKAYACVASTPDPSAFIDAALRRDGDLPTRHGSLLVLRELGRHLDGIPPEFFCETLAGHELLVPALLGVARQLDLSVLVKVLSFGSPECRQAAIEYLCRAPPADWSLIVNLIAAKSTPALHRQGCIAALRAVPDFFGELSRWSRILVSTARNTAGMSIECRVEVVQVLEHHYGQAAARGDAVRSCLDTQKTAEALLGLLRSDYTVDERGDVGSHVRYACMSVLPRLVSIEGHLEAAFLSLMCEQAHGRIDRLCCMATETLSRHYRQANDCCRVGMARGLVYAIPTRPESSLALLVESIRFLDMSSLVAECLRCSRLCLPMIGSLRLLVDGQHYMPYEQLISTQLIPLLDSHRSDIRFLFELVPLLQALRQPPIDSLLSLYTCPFPRILQLIRGPPSQPLPSELPESSPACSSAVV